MAVETIMWSGSSGKKYKYWIYLISTSFKDSPGNYIFAKEISPGDWKPIYIGETDSLLNRLSEHEKMRCVKLHRGKFVHVHIAPSDNETRRAEESDLLAKWDPPCNKE